MSSIADSCLLESDGPNSRTIGKLLSSTDSVSLLESLCIEGLLGDMESPGALSVAGDTESSMRVAVEDMMRKGVRSLSSDR
jgi:hypothetical protein